MVAYQCPPHFFQDKPVAQLLGAEVVAELMSMIAVVTIMIDDKRHRIVTNVKEVQQRIIACFGVHALETYGLPPDLARIEINYSNYKNLLHWCESQGLC